MKSCRKCRERKSCVRVCQEVEARLPKDETGKNQHLELSMDTAGFEAMLEMRSYVMWSRDEYAADKPDVDVSKLSPGERRAVILLASGHTQSEVASRLRISRATLRSRVKRARAKVCAARKSHLVEGGTL
jgi:DNA-binding CsgD family transcriptional regulator